MSETCAGPSELHLKRELTVLQKSRVLRDPGTHTSWKSPLSSNSFGTSVNLDNANENSENKKGVDDSSGSFELIPGIEKRRKKVYLYNWGNHSYKSNDSGLRLDEDSKQASAQNSPEKDLNTVMKMDSASDAYTGYPLNISGIKVKNPVIRTARKLNRVAVTCRRINKNSSTGKALDLETNSVRELRSGELSDVSGYCSSQELLQSKHKLTRKGTCSSHRGSPLLSGSGCGSRSKGSGCGSRSKESRCGSRSNSDVLKTARRREGSSHSYTPASNFSYSRHGARNPSIGGSFDRTSFSDGETVENLRRNQVCGLPCYWSKEMKEPDLRSCSSPSQSDTPSRTVRSILCGSRTMHSKRRSSGSRKQKYVEKSFQGVPLLANSFDVVDSSTDATNDELATTFEEIDLEAVSRLDGHRWSSCRSQEGAELSLPEGFDLVKAEQKKLSHKYRPRSFGEIVGQDIVVKSLNNAALRGKIAPAYLFQGPHGTGKTSTARIFAAALNCLSTEEDRPCGLCCECSNFSTGNVSSLKEVDARNKKDIRKLRLLLKQMVTGETFSRNQVFVIDECHMLSSKSWSEFMSFLEEPLSYVVFIFITIDSDILPHAVVSRCQRYHFPKIKDSDITLRLRKISAEENFDVELDALDLIALNSDGSLREAETMLEQLSLLGKRITTTLVNELVGLVSNERLLDLLEVALSSNTVETVKRSRELIESGADPVILMSQLAGLIMDIIAGTSQLPSSLTSGTVLGGRSLTEAEVWRLRQALKILSDAEKQLRVSSERSTWFTAALLQLNSGQSSQTTPSISSSRQNIERLDEVVMGRVRETLSSENKPSPSFRLHESSSADIPRVSSGRCSVSAPRRLLDITHKDDTTRESFPKCASPGMLDKIWRRCIERFDSERLRHLLYAHGKLVSITETNGVLIAYIAFGDGNIKSRAERFLNSITDSIRIILRHNVEVRIGLVPEKYLKALKSVPGSPPRHHTDMIEHLDEIGNQQIDYTRSSDIPRRSMDCSGTQTQAILGMVDAPVQRTSTEQRLESAWLQAAGRGEAPTVGHFKRGNDNLRQNGASSQNESRSFPDLSMSFKQWKDGQSDEIEEVETSESLGYHKERIRGGERRYHYPISPSLLHSSSFKTNFDQVSLGYESGPVRSGFCCWKASKPPRGKVKRGNDARPQRPGNSCFGQC